MKLSDIAKLLEEKQSADNNRSFSVSNVYDTLLEELPAIKNLDPQTEYPQFIARIVEIIRDQYKLGLTADEVIARTLMALSQILEKPK